MIIYIFYVKLNLTKTNFSFYIILIMKLYSLVFIICLYNLIYSNTILYDQRRS